MPHKDRDTLHGGGSVRDDRPLLQQVLDELRAIDEPNSRAVPPYEELARIGRRLAVVAELLAHEEKEGET